MRYPDVAAFQPRSITEETRAINAALAAKMAVATTPRDLADARLQFASGKRTTPVTAKSPDARVIPIASGAAEIGLRILAASSSVSSPASASTPASTSASASMNTPGQSSDPAPTGVYLHLHGGGWMVGTADMRDGQLLQLAQQTGLVCASLDYRLVPEHPYPAPVDDCVAAANWLIDHAMAEFGSDRLFIGGESAGAHLAVLTLLRLRDAGRVRHFLGANLAFGVYDLSLTPSAASAGDDIVCSYHEMIEASAAFRAGVDARSPEVSPLYADLAGLPAALFTVGSLDPLLDDSLLMSARWLGAGNDAELAVYPGGLHGFTTLEGRLAQQANERMATFLNARVETAM